MLHINENMTKLPGNYLFADISKRVKKFESENPDANIIKLGIGDVTKPITPAVISAMKKASDEMGQAETFHGYGPDAGYPFLIKAILDNDYKSRGINISEDEIFITDGAKSDVGNLQEIFSSDAIIAVTDPVYPVYVDSNAMSGRAGTYVKNKWDKMVYLPCTAENGFVPSLPQQAVDVIYLCYPNNPTGTTLNKAQLKTFVDYAIENGAVIIYDAAYKAFIHNDDVPLSIYEVEGADKVAIECCSFSKTAGFTGVRCAYTVIPKTVSGVNEKGDKVSLQSLWSRRQATKFNGVGYVIQRAAEAVYSDEGKKQCTEIIEYYMNNAKMIREGLSQAGYEVYGGIDAPYVWLKTPKDMSGWDFFDLLLNKAQVVGTPGEGFGPSGAGYFRLTSFNTAEKTAEALKRIKNI